MATATATSEMSFEDFVTKFKKDYKVGSAEWKDHASIYAKELARVRAHNANPKKSYSMGINKFSDMTEKERSAFFGFKRQDTSNFKSRTHQIGGHEKHVPVSALPTSVDWRDAGIVTAVKDQGHCGSCWAFAASAVLESHVAKNSGLLYELSPQQISSCTQNPDECGGTGGCYGATFELAFDYVAGSDGMYQEFQYPYNSYYGDDYPCETYADPVAYIEGYTKLRANNYTELMNAVATIGPIAVSVDASAWGPYESGVFDGCGTGTDMTSTDINHAVTLVGYGDCPEHGKYWLIRNSWSPDWGMEGYMKLRRSDDDADYCAMDTTPQDGSACAGEDDPVKVCGSCGVLFDTAYPTGAGSFTTAQDDRMP